MIKVFDTQTKTYRDILDNQEECNGLVCFSRDSIPIIEKYYLICGYYCIDTHRFRILQIDIQFDIVIIPEIVLLGLLPTFIQEMEEYNITDLPKVTLSYSFIYLWFNDENKTIDEVEPFALVCKQIISNTVLLNRFWNCQEMCSTAKALDEPVCNKFPTEGIACILAATITVKDSSV